MADKPFYIKLSWACHHSPGGGWFTIGKMLLDPLLCHLYGRIESNLYFNPMSYQRKNHSICWCIFHRIRSSINSIIRKEPFNIREVICHSPQECKPPLQSYLSSCTCNLKQDRISLHSVFLCIKWGQNIMATSWNLCRLYLWVNISKTLEIVPVT